MPAISSAFADISNSMYSFAKYPAAVLFLLLFGTYSTSAQDTDPASVAQDIDPASVRIRIIGNESQPLRIQSVDYTVSIVGGVASTRVDVTVFNPNDRVMEGSFEMPVGEDQTVSGLALDIDGILRTGVVVSKTKGRKVFESIVRRRVDPALAERTEANTFNVRIFPIPPKGTRRVVVTLDQPLSVGADGFSYRLPLRFPEPLESFHLELNVTPLGLPPSTERSELKPRFELLNKSYKATITRRDVLLSTMLQVDVPVAVHKWAALTGELKGQVYTMISHAHGLLPQTQAAPAGATIYYDCSLSRLHASERERAFLSGITAAIGAGGITLVPFSDAVHPRKPLPVVNGSSPALIKEIATMLFDGATNLAAIPLDSARGFNILITDGIGTTGSRTFRNPSVPLVVVSTSISADREKLKALAQSSGGVYIDLMTTDADSAVNVALRHLPVLTGIRVLEGVVTDIYPPVPSTVLSVATISARVKGPKAVLELAYSVDGVSVLVDTITVDATDGADGEHHGLIPRMWATQAIGKLARDRIANKDSITAIGLEFSVVTPGTSLLVLENIEDYVNYDIRPPNDLPDFVKEFDRSIAEARREAAIADQNHIRAVMEGFVAEKEWYLAPTGSYRKSMRDGIHNRLSGNGSGRGMSAGAAPPPDRDGSQSDDESGQIDSYAPSMAREFDAETYATDAADAKESASLDEIRGLNQGEEEILAKLRELPTNSFLPMYASLRPLRASAWFYLEAAKLCMSKQMTKEGFRMMSNIAELYSDDPTLLRVYAGRLRLMRRNQEALATYMDILRLREEEPQSWRDVGLVHGELGNVSEAMRYLSHVITHRWDSRFNHIEQIVIREANNLRKRYANKEFTLDSAFVMDEEYDLRIVVTWDADNTDVDLWVTEPDGEECYYSNRDTKAGGRMSQDFTGGYGPEEYRIRKATVGDYNVRVKLYGDRRMGERRPITIVADTWRNFGRANQSVDRRMVVVDNDSMEAIVTNIRIENKQ